MAPAPPLVPAVLSPLSRAVASTQRLRRGIKLTSAILCRLLPPTSNTDSPLLPITPVRPENYALGSVCYPITSLGELLLLAHTNGSILLSCGASIFNSRRQTHEQQAVKWTSSTFNLRTPLVFPAGWFGSPRFKVLVAPLPFVPPPAAIIRTAKRQLRMQHAAPMTLASLVGETSYDVAATAYPRRQLPSVFCLGYGSYSRWGDPGRRRPLSIRRQGTCQHRQGPYFRRMHPHLLASAHHALASGRSRPS